MHVLLTGSTGRLGGAFRLLWGQDPECRHSLRYLTRQDVDLSDTLALRSCLERLWSEQAYDVIINPAAISGLEACLDDDSLAWKVNVDAPRVMAEFAAEKGIRMVHFSTDYVFGGEEPGRRREEDAAVPVNVYGQTKLAGERAVLGACASSLVGRVSWLFGPVGSNRGSHFDSVLERARSGQVQHLIGDKYSVPTYTHDIVEWVDHLLQANASGLYHLCNSGPPESWFSYAKEVCRLAQQHDDISLTGEFVESSIHKVDFFRERRPVHTAMLPARLIEEHDVIPRHWLEAAEEYLKLR
ncbi:NAD(P)-dependent oxidoreductase [Verrucomicrobiaceae bacterium N1E253]|uniref:dTDP-4-dehydrorhamnose reductase n=1 Tax=Oceaniferula marina TaxID=2748318 RepID=A0A851GNQ5_9BACT|nr:NAD(P)-dependent oxidoreductase [Oceaniferula marina]NWK56460.1 NAD(P)-dependent oxidoreductase [Oceaniferula marina]